MRCDISKAVAFCLALSLLFSFQTSTARSEEEPIRLLDSIPFDRITLNRSNGSHQIDVMLLDLPNRELPDPLPENGGLEIRRLDEPSVPYRVSWSTIAKVELFEQLLLAETVTLIRKTDFSEAYNYLIFLEQHYASLPGLQKVKEQYLIADFKNAFDRKQYEEALVVLLTLYEMNPRRAGLARVVQRVSDQLITEHLKSQDFNSARIVLDIIVKGFPDLDISSVTSWRQKFSKNAENQLNRARESIANRNFENARASVRHAIAILPDVAGATDLLDEINRLSPRVVVGVTMHGTNGSEISQFDWPAARVHQLLSPNFVELSGFGAEGGTYSCRWADLSLDDSGLELEIQLNELALNEGFSPEKISLHLLSMAVPQSHNYQVGFRELLEDVMISSGDNVLVRWKLSHVRPETLLQIPIQSFLRSDSDSMVYQAFANTEEVSDIRFRLPEQESKVSRSHSIIERVITDEEVALASLLNGKVDALDRIPPWQVERAQQAKEIVVQPYQLPTLHVLVPNYNNPILKRREFRRALVYGINRSRILNEIILGGDKRPGFRLLSGPFNRSIRASSDPVGFAYKQSIKPRPYEPQLAVVLATLARNAIAKKPSEETRATEREEASPAPKPLVLAHPPDALALAACQTIKKDLDAIGIPISLLKLPSSEVSWPDNYDLLYTELTVWEPIVDAKRILGPGGTAGTCSAAMSLALRNVDSSSNWKELRTHLHQVHQVAFNDLPVIPLWQTVNHFAYRRDLTGINSNPVTLYQDVDAWRAGLARGGL